MSAYVVDYNHIRFLVAAAFAHRVRVWGHFTAYHNQHTGQRIELPANTESELGQMLWDENVASINGRYPDTIDNPDNMPGPIGEDLNNYRHKCWPDSPQPVDVFKALACYEYQSCEHDGWEKSNARAFCNALRRAYCSALPGYEDAEWGAPELASDKRARLLAQEEAAAKREPMPAPGALHVVETEEKDWDYCTISERISPSKRHKGRRVICLHFEEEGTRDTVKSLIGTIAGWIKGEFVEFWADNAGDKEHGLKVARKLATAHNAMIR